MYRSFFLAWSKEKYSWQLAVCSRQSFQLGTRDWALGTKTQRSRRPEVIDQRSDDRWFKVLNIEQQNKKPQNDEVMTSIFEISCSTFCGSKKR